MTGSDDGISLNTREMFDLTGTTAIVTGGASGLGRAITHGLADAGANVAVADIDDEGGRHVAETVDGNAVAVEADVTDSDSLGRLRDRVTTEFDGYEVVFNIPGTNHRVPAFELSDEKWEEIIDLNLTGVFKSARALGKPLVEQGHVSVVNMASIRGIDGGPDQSAYSASKGGVIQLTKALAAEWAPDVRVNALAPGYVKTELVREAMEDREWYERMRERHMLERFADPEEVVGGAVYLASDASSFVTGSTLVIDGGWTAQ